MSSSVPLLPVPLSEAAEEAMLQRQIKKHHVAIILVHWFNAITWILELLTGAALITSRHFRIAPDGYLALFGDLFGTRASLLRFHVTLGLTWLAVLVPYGLFGWRKYLNAEMLHVTDPDDVSWLLIRVRRILGRTDEPLPPQGIYNAGQKAFALVVWTMTPVVAISGVIMTFQLFAPSVVGWSVVLHFVAVGAVLAGLFVHVYMGAVFPEERPAFFSMITGTVNELFAYKHHFKWWRQVKLEELAREQADEARRGAGNVDGH